MCQSDSAPIGIDFTEEATFYVSFNYLIIINTTKVMYYNADEEGPESDLLGEKQWRLLSTIWPAVATSLTRAKRWKDWCACCCGSSFAR
jgi:hypothetical protein